MEANLKMHDVQSIAIKAPPAAVFAYVAEPANLPHWTAAFSSAGAGSAKLRSPSGEVDIQLETIAHEKAGTVDWIMTFPDRTIGQAFSRITPDGPSGSVYCFLLMAPPVPLEAVEGALDMQKSQLAEELLNLKRIMERK
jgi:hypothetical protein